MQYTFFIVAALSLGLLACSSGDSPEDTSYSGEFVAGQVWTYKTRPAEEASRLVICRIESLAKWGQVAHIHVENLQVQSPAAPGGVSSFIGHMPIAMSDLRASVLSLESTREVLPDFEAGYDTWKEASLEGRAGVWTAPVAEVIDGIEQGLNR